MLRHDLGTVTALQFNICPSWQFEDIVDELDCTFQSAAFNRRSLAWDCDDVALLDRGPMRIALGWVSPQNSNESWYLIVAVGPSPEAGGNAPDPEACAAVAQRITERAEKYLPLENIFRSDANMPVDAELIDTVVEHLLDYKRTDVSPKADNIDEDLSTLKPYWARMDWARLAFESRNGVKDSTANATAPGTRDPDEAKIKQVREVLCEIYAEKAISLPMHICLYTFSLSMALQVPSVGIAMFVYNILREDFLPFT
jgi:hypothetical protein